MKIQEINEYAQNNDLKIYKFESPSFDKSILGLSVDNKIIYDYELMVEEYMKDQNCDLDEAIDFIEYNTLRSLSYLGGDAPIILYIKEY